MENTNKLYVMIITQLDPAYTLNGYLDKTSTYIYSSKEELKEAFDKRVNWYREQYNFEHYDNQKDVRVFVDGNSKRVNRMSEDGKQIKERIYNLNYLSFEFQNVVKICTYETGYGERVENN